MISQNSDIIYLYYTFVNKRKFYRIEIEVNSIIYNKNKYEEARNMKVLFLTTKHPQSSLHSIFKNLFRLMETHTNSQIPT